MLILKSLYISWFISLKLNVEKMSEKRKSE